MSDIIWWGLLIIAGLGVLALLYRALFDAGMALSDTLILKRDMWELQKRVQKLEAKDHPTP